MSHGLADDELAAFLDVLNSQPFAAAEQGADALRHAAEQRSAARPRGPSMDRVVDVTVPGDPARPARIYRPTPTATDLVLALHGGGFVIGDLDTHDRTWRRLAARADVCVLALDYRRVPEHPWPAAVDDAVTAMRWIATEPAELGVSSGSTAIIGDSAGGTIAALTCLRLRDEAPDAMPTAQVLVYANTDLTDSGESMAEKGHGFGLELADIEWFNAQWVPDAVRRGDPAVSPLAAPDLAALPTAAVVTCEHDPLRDQGEAYAQRLRDAGVLTTLRREPGLLHNFLLWDTVSPACAAAGDRVADDLAVVLAAGRRQGGQS